MYISRVIYTDEILCFINYDIILIKLFTKYYKNGVLLIILLL